MESAMSETLVQRGVLKGHRNWVTGIATCFENPHAYSQNRGNQELRIRLKHSKSGYVSKIGSSASGREILWDSGT